MVSDTDEIFNNHLNELKENIFPVQLQYLEKN